MTSEIIDIEIINITNNKSKNIIGAFFSKIIKLETNFVFMSY